MEFYPVGLLDRLERKRLETQVHAGNALRSQSLRILKRGPSTADVLRISRSTPSAQDDRVAGVFAFASTSFAQDDRVGCG